MIPPVLCRLSVDGCDVVGLRPGSLHPCWLSTAVEELITPQVWTLPSRRKESCRSHLVGTGEAEGRDISFVWGFRRPVRLSTSLSLGRTSTTGTVDPHIHSKGTVNQEYAGYSVPSTEGSEVYSDCRSSRTQTHPVGRRRKVEGVNEIHTRTHSRKRSNCSVVTFS